MAIIYTWRNYCAW